MKNLIVKELKLALHPAAIMFLFLSAMLLIPNYPYYVIFFYTSLGLFFICLTGRENNDIFYSMTLPISRRDIVASRIMTAVILELLQMIVAIPFAVIRQKLPIAGNEVGMDANISLFGLAFLMLGIYNIVFFASYYKNPNRVGISFIKASTVEFFYIAIAETVAHILPFVRDTLDTPDTVAVLPKLICLVVGILLYAMLTYLAYRISVKHFEPIDL